MPTDDFVAYQEARARGGAAAIFIEATAVHPTGLLTSHSHRRFHPDVVAATGGSATRSAARRGLFLQLFHGGRERITAAPRAPGGRAVGRAVAALPVEPRALTRARHRRSVAGSPTAPPRRRDGGRRRPRGVDVARLPRRAVLLADDEPPRRRVRPESTACGSRARC